MPGLHGNGSGVFDSIFGDGSDRDVTISADTVLLRDMQYNNLTALNGVRIFANGYKIRVRQRFVLQGDSTNVAAVLNNGANARNSNGSVAEVSGANIPVQTLGGAAGTLPAGGVGAQGMYNGGFPFGSSQHDAGGGAGTMVPAVSGATSPTYFLGGKGGTGGTAQITVTGSSFTYAGMTGSSGAFSVNAGTIHSFFAAMHCGVIGLPNAYTGSFSVFAGGAGGGAGACGNSGSVGVRPRSGWGGGGAGVVYIAAREFQFLGEVRVQGGNGGNSFSFGSGGGGGGGGFVYIVYSSLLLRNTLIDQVKVAGGAPGLGYALSPAHNPTSGSLGSFFTFGV
jgi:hypothetical protein